MTTVDTDKELINQLTNLKKEMVERLDELESRGHIVKWVAATDKNIFTIIISKTVKTEEVI